jgi:hypothetical protein
LSRVPAPPMASAAPRDFHSEHGQV